jgi:hypothetical protein
MSGSVSTQSGPQGAAAYPSASSSIAVTVETHRPAVESQRSTEHGSKSSQSGGEPSWQRPCG